MNGCGGDTDDDKCYFSNSEERRCELGQDGQMRCEVLKRVWRHCPGKPPEQVKVEQSEMTGDAAEGILGDLSPFSSFFNGRDDSSARSHGSLSIFSEENDPFRRDGGGWSFFGGRDEPSSRRDYSVWFEIPRLRRHDSERRGHEEHDGFAKFIEGLEQPMLKLLEKFRPTDPGSSERPRLPRSLLDSTEPKAPINIKVDEV